MSRSFIDRLEMIAEAQETGPFKAWLLYEIIPMASAKESGKARAARRWAGHEPKTLSEKRAASRERQRRYRERKADTQETAPGAKPATNAPNAPQEIPTFRLLSREEVRAMKPAPAPQSIKPDDI